MGSAGVRFSCHSPGDHYSNSLWRRQRHYIPDRVIFTEMVCKYICFKILPPVFYHQPGSGISGNLYLPFSGYPRSLCPGKIRHERERTFKIHFPVTYYCTRYRYRLYHVPVPDLNFKDPGIYRTFSRSFHGNTAICDPCGRLFHGAV